LKPLQKGVTASDVENCLYYVHLDAPEDEKLLVPSHLEDPSSAESSEKAVGGYSASGRPEAVRRKPLAPGDLLASGNKIGPPSDANHHYQSPLYNHHYDFRSHDPRYQPPLHDPHYQPTLHVPGYPPPLHDPNHQPPLHDHNYQPLHEVHRVGRKPAPPAAHSGAVGGISSQSGRSLNGPRPIRSRLQTTDGRLQQTDTSRHSADLSRRYGQPSLSPSEPELRAIEPGARFRHSYAGSTDNVPEEAEVASPAKVLRFRRGRKFSAQEDCKRYGDRDTSLTLIRRYDGLQANVGKILCTGERRNGPPDTASADRSPLKSSIEISIQIFTAGYRRLVGLESRLPCQPPSTSGASPTTVGVEQDNIFHRQLRTVSARSRPGVPKESSQPYPRSQSTSDVKRSSEQANGGMQMDGLSPPPRPDTMQSDNKGHTFDSPWHGLCEFHTGIAGRSLKCTHISRATNNVSMSSASVSELRFNLPSSSALGPPRTQLSSDSSRSSKRSSIFPHHRAKSAFEIQSSSSYGSKIELEERMDLSLAKERAGGGFGGKHAKLGKLIIEHEGLKMLDLVVAANIALVSNLSNLYLPYLSFLRCETTR